jgi:hypothetical protein
MLRILIGATLIALLSLAQFNTALYGNFELHKT